MYFHVHLLFECQLIDSELYTELTAYMRDLKLDKEEQEEGKEEKARKHKKEKEKKRKKLEDTLTNQFQEMCSFLLQTQGFLVDRHVPLMEAQIVFWK